MLLKENFSEHWEMVTPERNPPERVLLCQRRGSLGEFASP